jgi:hypothetical protein
MLLLLKFLMHKLTHNHNAYYFSNGVTTESKILALEYEKTLKQECNLFYYDHSYDNVNWKIEPPLSLNEYYVEQAKKIRDSYDYVILCYSGGIDSTNILETFHYNNIKLDKILSVGAFSQDSYAGDDTNHNGEIYHNVFPYIQELGLKDIFQVIDYTKIFFDLKTLSYAQTNTWIEKSGNWFSPHHWVWNDIQNYAVPFEMRNKKVAIIFGKDKPTLSKDSKGMYFHFNDAATGGYFMGKDNIDAINFYWDPTFPEILVKQLHIINRYTKMRNELDVRLDTERFIQVINGKSVHDLIYDLKKPLAYLSKKSPSNIISLRDTYLKTSKNSDLYDMFSDGVKQLHARLGQSKVPVRLSKRYYIV